MGSVTGYGPMDDLGVLGLDPGAGLGPRTPIRPQQTHRCTGQHACTKQSPRLVKRGALNFPFLLLFSSSRMYSCEVGLASCNIHLDTYISFEILWKALIESLTSYHGKPYSKVYCKLIGRIP